MILKFLGCGSAFNPLLGNTSAYFVQGENLFIIDAGESVFKNLFELGLLKEYKNIFIMITHAHADHVGSLASIISYSYFVLHKKVTVIHPNGTIIELLERLGICKESYIYPKKKQLTIMEVEVKAIPVKHVENMECFGYIIETKDSRIFYSGDSYEIPEEVLQEFLGGKINLIYQDTAEYETEYLSHCPLKTLEDKIPIEYRSKIYCMHFSNNFTKKIVEKGFRFVEVTS